MLVKQFDSIEDHKSDFTYNQYVELLQVAKLNYEFVGYEGYTPVGKYVYWRHDVDLSLNRAVRLAQIEYEEGVRATYFLNPHCEFYNLLEKNQAQIVKKILSLGHDIGLHFDVGFYQVENEKELDKLVIRESELLQYWFGVRVNVFSFHNPNTFMLSCEKEKYGELINCYSKYFKTSVPYCSDSNGYWRYRRLRDVLEAATDKNLQVLTHPGLWQDMVLSPRERVFRSVYGRANKVLFEYDKVLAEHGRANLGGLADNLKFFKEIDTVHYQLCDFLWNNRMLHSLFIELYRWHVCQIKQLCKAMFCKVWRVPMSNVDEFFESSSFAIDGWELFEAVFGISWAKASGCSNEERKVWVKVYEQLFYESAHIPSGRIEEGCVHLCEIIESIAKWGSIQEKLECAGITDFSKLNKHEKDISNTIDLSYSKKWEEFKVRFQ